MKRKSQMEIMGLAIIIILLALAILFVLQFIIMKPTSDIKKSFTHKEMAANTVNSMLDTTTDCRDLSIAQLIEDCAEGGYIQCPTGNSCTHVQRIIENILNNTLEQWNKEYYLTITTSQGDVLDPFGRADPCPGEKITSSPCCTLPTGAGPLDVKLEICS